MTEKDGEKQKQELRKRYQEYLESLYNEKSPKIFTNGGIEHASELMAKMFDVTKKEVRMFCRGLCPTLIQTDPYFSAFKKYVGNKEGNRTIKIMVETDEYVNEEPFQILIKEKEARNDNAIEYKKIKEKDKKEIFSKLFTDHCNFSVFDDDKFRLEISPSEYKALGSFNDRVMCGQLIKLFDDAFNNAEPINDVFFNNANSPQCIDCCNE